MSRSTPCLALFALFGLVPLVACSTGETSAPVAEVIDSAGVRLVLNHLPDGPLGTGGLSLDAEPMLEIGTFEGDALYQLYRVGGARRLADGRIVVANAGSFEVRVYGADGRYERAWGREGGGPGPAAPCPVAACSWPAAPPAVVAATVPAAACPRM